LRRQFLIAAAALVVAPLAPAQTALRRIAWFGAGRAGTPSPFLDATRAGLRDRGWEEGRNLALSPFWADGTLEDAQRLAREMSASNPEIIIVFGREVFAVHRVKPAAPVVFAFSGDPVDAGFVQSFARPGGNFTGISFLSLDLVGKRVELLREMVPQMRRLAVLARPEHPGEHRERAVSEEIARKLGLEVAYVPIQAAGGLDGALQAVARQNVDSLVAFPDAVMLANSGRIASFAAQAKIATVSGWSGFADNGFLLTYGPNLHASFRALARHVDRVLRGAKPADLPVELPSKVECVINLKTAKVLGLKVPQSVLLRADRVIE
jgi:putative ABC transport system substrate-binding protein